MLSTADIFVCVILCSLQRRLDGFPTPIPRRDLNGVRSTAQPAVSSSSHWMFPTTRLHSSYRRDWISSTSLLLLPMTSHNRISLSYPSSTDNDNGRDEIRSSDPLSPPLSDPLSPSLSEPLSSEDDQVVIPPFEQQPYPSFDNKDMSRVLYGSSQPPLTDNGLNTSPLSDNKLKISSMSSCVMRPFNFRVSKTEEAPMILFDENGKMYTNYYLTRLPPGTAAIKTNKY